MMSEKTFQTVDLIDDWAPPVFLSKRRTCNLNEYEIYARKTIQKNKKQDTLYIRIHIGNEIAKLLKLEHHTKIQISFSKKFPTKIKIEKTKNESKFGSYLLLHTNSAHTHHFTFRCPQNLEDELTVNNAEQTLQIEFDLLSDHSLIVDLLKLKDNA